MTKNSVEALWCKCLAIIKDNIPATSFSTWFQPIVPLEYKDNTFVIQVPSMFFYEFIEEKYAELLYMTLNKEIGEGTRLNYRVLVDSSSKATTDVTSTSAPSKERVPHSIIAKTSSPFDPIVRQDIDPQLNASYNFNTFIEGTSNKLARTTGISVANDPGATIFNPMFIYGAPTVGKTHLAHAIGIMTKQLHPEKRVLYVSANLFKIQYTDAVRRNETNDFLNFYQSLDMLIIDDIQDFMNLEGTQNTFFHIFNHLQQLGKQLVMTADRTPKDMQGMEERLLTRFQWGLSVEISKPDLELRKAILRNRICNDGLDVPEEVVDYIAENVTDNVRNLIGVLVSLLAHTTFGNEPINLALAEKIVGKVADNTPKAITVEMIRDLVCEHFAITADMMMSKSRRREITVPRQLAMYLSKCHTKNSLSAIGKVIGNRDHATVLHACSVVNDLMDTDKRFRHTVTELETKLKKQ